MKIYKKSDYRLYFHPEENVFRLVVEEAAHIPARHGYIEFPFVTGEERDMFKMLYPCVNGEMLQEFLDLWQSFTGSLTRAVYSPGTLEIASQKSSIFFSY